MGKLVFKTGPGMVPSSEATKTVAQPTTKPAPAGKIVISPKMKVDTGISAGKDLKPLHKAIDAYADAVGINDAIDAEIKVLTAKKINMEPLEEALLPLVKEHYHEQWANKTAEFFAESKKNQIKFGKMGIQRIITNIEYVFNKLKKKAFLEQVKFPLTAIDNYLTPEEKKECLEITDTKRTMKVVGPSEAAKKK